MYYKLKEYFDLSVEDRAAYLRTNGYCYDIEQTAYLPDQLLADFKKLKETNPSAPIPQLSPCMAQSTDSGKKIMISYALFMPAAMQKAYARPRYISDLNHIVFNSHGKSVNFFDCFVKNIINANTQFKEAFGDTVKVRVYCSMDLYFLSGLFSTNGIEVHFVREFKDHANYERADYWRLLACGDSFNADYTFVMDADEENPVRWVDFIKAGMAGEYDLFHYNVPNTEDNDIDPEFRLSLSYIQGQLFGVNNRSKFFEKYKILDLLTAYYVITAASKSKFSGIDLYPEFGYQVKPAINIDAYCLNKRCLTEYHGDQCFLNSTLFFGMLNSGGKYMLALPAPEPAEKLYCKNGIDFNLVRYLDEKPNAEIVYI